MRFRTVGQRNAVARGGAQVVALLVTQVVKDFLMVNLNGIFMNLFGISEVDMRPKKLNGSFIKLNNRYTKLNRIFSCTYFLV